MNLRKLFFTLVVGVTLAAGWTGRGAGSEVEFGDLRDGKEIAAYLRSLVPGDTADGQMAVRRRRQRTERFAIASEVEVGESGWKVTYHVTGGRDRPEETLTVVCSAGKPNVYLYAAGSREPRCLSGDEANLPLAGSDFWLTDLGLEFLHWPNQIRLKGEIKRGQSCHVLESRAPAASTNGYSRVVSWIDKDSGGILQAEAYDQNDTLLKEFSVGSFKKVNGVYHLRDIEMENRQTDSRTRINFDIPEQD